MIRPRTMLRDREGPTMRRCLLMYLFLGVLASASVTMTRAVETGPAARRPACCIVEDVSANFGCSPFPTQVGGSGSPLCSVFAMVERLVCGPSASCTVAPPPPPPPPPPYPY